MPDPRRIAKDYFQGHPKATKRDVEEHARSVLDDDEFIMQVYMHFFIIRTSKSAMTREEGGDA
jgi:hypothetical protein